VNPTLFTVETKVKFGFSKQSIRALVKSTIRRARALNNHFHSAIYDVRCYFKPHNRLTLHALPRTWSDRDAIMFHAMFQILVDFVELEQPFKDWETKWSGKRYTDRPAMTQFIEQARLELLKPPYEGMSVDELCELEKTANIYYRKNVEVFRLYEWYKDEKYDIDHWKLYEKTGEKYVFTGNELKMVPNGKEKLITWNELREIEDEHDIMCERMLQRVLAIRKYLWT